MLRLIRHSRPVPTWLTALKQRAAKLLIDWPFSSMLVFPCPSYDGLWFYKLLAFSFAFFVLSNLDWFGGRTLITDIVQTQIYSIST